MLVLRFVGLIAGLGLLGLAIAFVVTRDRRYLKYAVNLLQVVVLLVVAFGLVYLFERVLLMV